MDINHDMILDVLDDITKKNTINIIKLYSAALIEAVEKLSEITHKDAFSKSEQCFDAFDKQQKLVDVLIHNMRHVLVENSKENLFNDCENTSVV